MAFTRKNKRRIVVDGHLLYWVASGDDGYISLSLMSDFDPCGKVFASFDYHQILVPKISATGVPYTAIGDQFVITPYIVRQVADLAMSKGWMPTEKCANLYLGAVDSYIDLRIR
jgi:hypothetical protein